MRLIEAMVDANHRALQGDPKAGLDPKEFANVLPLAALTCIDPRLNPLLPGILGISAENFIWLRNAGNIITGSLSSTVRSIALACVIKGAREIAIIGHTDCRVCKTSMLDLLNGFAALGISRSQLPDNLVEYFGMFASETQNVMKGVDLLRNSPVIGPAIPVHGLLVEIQTGRLEWLINGYQALGSQIVEAKSNSSFGESISSSMPVLQEQIPQAEVLIERPPIQTNEIPPPLKENRREGSAKPPTLPKSERTKVQRYATEWPKPKTSRR